MSKNKQNHSDGCFSRFSSIPCEYYNNDYDDNDDDDCLDITDRRRFSYLADTANNQIQDVRRETMVLNRPDATPTNMPVIYDAGNDDDDDDDEDAFMPVSSKTFVKQDTQDKSDITWDELYNFDGDDGDQGENTEIIYYPPSESDGSDTMASSYQVFDAGLNSDRRRTQYKHSISINSNADGDSETTDPVSLDDIEDDDDSNNSVPTTPLEDNTKSQTREKFLKDTFENLSFTPNQTDKFVKGLEALEEEVDNVPVGTITSRQSLSARFLSKSQAARNIGPYGSIQRQDNWFDSVQRRKDDMARNLDESRKMLMAMGWKQESPETDVEDPFKSPTSPSDVSNKLEQSKGTTTTPSNDGIKNLTSTLRDHQPPPTSAVGASTKSSDQNTPTSRRSISTSSRPRTLPLDGSGGRVTPTDKSTNKMAGKKDTPTGSQSSTRLSEYKKNKRTSTPNLNRVSLVSPEPKRLSAGSNLAKSKSSSMHNLIFEEEQELTPRGTNRKPRSKWSTKLSTFASVPDLLNPDDDGKLPPVDTAKSDINDNVKGRKTTTKKSPQVGSRSQPEVRLTRRAASTSRLNSDSDKKPAGKKAGSNTLTQQKSVDKGKDRDLMPPPALTNVAKSKHETRFMNRAQQPRRKTTGGSELSFEEAMNILQGNSGILNGKNEKDKRSTSISPTRSKSRLIKNTENEDKNVVELDKDDFVSGAPDSETSSIDSRKSSNSSTSTKSVDKKRDLRETAENDKTRSGITKSSTKVSVKPLQSKDIDIDSLTNEYKDALRDSGVSTQDEDDCPSPSVKERIARLNKHTSVTSDKRSTPNSIKTLTRSDSPVSNSSNSPRQTSSIQINFSSSPSMSTGSSISTSTSNDNITIIDNSASPVRTGDFNQSNVHINTDDTTSINQTTGTSHSMLPNTNTSPVAGMATSLTSDTRTSPASGMATSLTSDTRTSPNSGLGTSLDSEGLSHHLSPGNQSAGSPRSVADTGLGSDTDLDSSQTFRRGQLIGPGDIHSMVDKMDQMLVLMNQISTQYKQIPDTRENGYQDLTSECNQRFTRLCQTYCDTFNISLLSLTGKQEILNDTINELQRNMQKVKDLINS
ncbi:mitogen-activated protein kinase binding protein 1 [Mactra antiquata]